MSRGVRASKRRTKGDANLGENKEEEIPPLPGIGFNPALPAIRCVPTRPSPHAGGERWEAKGLYHQDSPGIFGCHRRVGDTLHPHFGWLERVSWMASSAMCPPPRRLPLPGPPRDVV